ncbi:MAG: single-stranded DNA-binding protein [Huintestinicola sp.]
MNKAIILGRLTADPELRQTQNGAATCDFTIAVDRYSADGNGQADFIRCKAWNKTAETICKYLGKGRKILVEGNIKTGSYTDRRYPDVTHYTSDIWVDRFDFCDSKSDNSGTQPPHNQTPSRNNPQPAQTNIDISPDLSDFEEVISDSDLPF